MSRSVLDFLYQDAKRVGSLLAQFDPNGVLMTLTQTQTYTESSEVEDAVSGALSILAAKGSAKEKEKNTEGTGAGASRAYDPLWSNSLSLLKLLQNEGMLHRGISNAGLGQLVLISGSLEVFDLPMIKDMLSNMGALRQFFEEKEGKQLKPAEWKKRSSSFHFVSCLPMSVQAMLTAGDSKVWTILAEDCLQISATSLFLKYGCALFGEWSMLGILDALPNPDGPMPEPNGEPETGMDIVRHMRSIHERLGRPRDAYSVTPLLIYRKVDSVTGANSAVTAD